MKKYILIIGVLLTSVFSYGQACNLICSNNVNVSMNASTCTMSFGPTDLLRNPTNSPSCGYKLQIEYPQGTTQFSPANRLNLSHQGYNMKFYVFDTINGGSCWGTFKVNYCNQCNFPTPPVVNSFTVNPAVGPYPAGIPLTFDVTATDNVSIQKVELYNWTIKLATDFTFPYTFNIKTDSITAREYRFRAIVYDNCGEKDTSDFIILTTDFPRCNDGYKNGAETGIDCGTQACGACHGGPPYFNLPDLTVKLNSVPWTINPGQYFTLSGFVKNKGTANSDAAKLVLALSNDTYYSTYDLTLAVIQVPWLAPGDSTPFSVSVYIPNHIGYGPYYILGCVDPQYWVLELDEDNNCDYKPINFQSAPVTPMPDLITTYLAVSKNPIYTYDTFTVGFMVNNIGTATSPWSQAGIYLSSNSTWDSYDQKLAEYNTPSLPANGNYTIQAPITQSLPAGNYYIIVCADHKNQVWESSESNNCSAIPFYVHGSSYPPPPPPSYGQPDLIVQNVSANPNPVAMQAPFNLSFNVKNQGEGPAGNHKIAAYLSYNSVVDNLDSKITEFYLSGLSAHQVSATLVTEVTKNIFPGSYYIIVCADDQAQVNEVIESNNCTAIAFTVTEGYVPTPDPDLTISQLALSANPVIAGNNLAVSFRVNNLGTVPAGAQDVGIYLSNNSALDGSDLLIGTAYAPSINGGNWFNTSDQVTAPNSPGNYYIIVCADYDRFVSEQSENNNCSAISLTVNPQPVPLADLIILQMTAPSNILTGSAHSVVVQIKNNGNATMPQAVAGALRLSTNAGGSGATLLSNFSIPALNSGETYQTTVNFSISDPVWNGPNYLIICADASNLVTESSEGNNCQSAAINISVPIVDLKNTTAVSFLNSIPKGTTFTLPFAVANIGTLVSTSFATEYYISFKPLLKSGSVVNLLKDTIKQVIAPGDTIRKNVSLTIPVTASAGTMYLNICVDPDRKLIESSTINNCQSIRIVISNPALQSLETRSNPASVTSWSVYPNPVKDVVQLRGDFTAGARYQLTDVTGKVLIAQAVTDNKINLSDVHTGMYLLNLIQGTERKTFKLIKE